ncbi:MAG TPA: EAL domain-containing protein [Burkholderiales bacterium]|jgi:diguanylate cyclase (GGDEF)-like protein
MDLKRLAAAWRRLTGARELQRLQYLAHHDALTGLPNRAMFEERAAEAIARARRRRETVALLLLDLDQLKEVNDGLGHEAGDVLLKTAAARLRGCLRGEDFVARIGGDEFCVLLQDLAEPREAASVAQKLLAALAPPCRIGAHQAGIGASIGIACLPRDGEDTPALLRAADAAMYRAKEAGRNDFRFASADLNRQALASAALVEELRASLARDELLVAYQLRVDLASGRAVGAEAMLRWPHRRFGLLPPESFLPLAEDAEIATALAAKLLRYACADAKRWRDGGARDFTLAIAVSMRQLRQAGLPGQVAAALAASGLPAQALLLEVPEGALQPPAEPVQATLRALAETGARLGVEDFGAGFASLPLLRRLRIASLGVDRLLVSGIPGDPDAMAVVRGLIALARGLDIGVVVKGLDTAAHCNFVVEAGGLVGQGAFLATPAAAPEVERLLHTRRAA